MSEHLTSLENALSNFPRDRRGRLFCPKCNSFYLDHGHCEDCGYRPLASQLGGPLGPKSFYAVLQNRESEKRTISYWLRCLISPINYPKKRRQNYKQRLTNRLRELVDFFDNEDSSPSNIRTIYLFELKSLIRELKSIKTKDNVIWLEVNLRVDDGSRFPKLLESILEEVRNERNDLQELSINRRSFHMALLGMAILCLILLFGLFVGLQFYGVAAL